MHQSEARQADATGAANNGNARAHIRLFPKERFLPGVRTEEAGHQRKSGTGSKVTHERSGQGSVGANKLHFTAEQEVAALRDFGPAYDRSGSVALDRHTRAARGMSVSPPIASELWHRSEMTRGANRVVMRRSKKDRYSITSSAQASGTHLMRISTRQRRHVMLSQMVPLPKRFATRP
jgi:hypothetical protein